MNKILVIARKDLLQLVRDRNIFLFLLIMPIAMTLLLGFAFGGFSRDTDNRIPVGFLDLDGSRLSKKLSGLLSNSELIRLQTVPNSPEETLRALVADNKLAGAIIIPAGYGEELLRGRLPRLKLITDTSKNAGQTVESEVLSAVQRIESATRAALVLERVSRGGVPFDYTFQQALDAWSDPPIRVIEEKSSAIPEDTGSNAALAHTSPGMMLQFAIAGLLTTGQIIVAERRTHALQRLLTTNTSGLTVLGGHYLAIFLLICGQFLVLILFGQLLLKVNYLRAPDATLVIALSSALCISALGLLIGVLAKTEDQAVIFSLVPMFVLGGLGGTMVPLDVTGETFRMIGHLSPLAWAMDGLNNILMRGLGVKAVLFPALMLVVYTLFFGFLAVWQFSRYEARN